MDNTTPTNDRFLIKNDILAVCREIASSPRACENLPVEDGPVVVVTDAGEERWSLFIHKDIVEPIVRPPYSEWPLSSDELSKLLRDLVKYKKYYDISPANLPDSVHDIPEKVFLPREFHR